MADASTGGYLFKTSHETESDIMASPNIGRKRELLKRYLSETRDLVYKAGSHLSLHFVLGKEAREEGKAIIYILKGMLKGFLIYAIPVSILERKPAGLRRSLVLSIFVGCVRSFDRLLKWLNREDTPKLPWNLQKHLPLYGIAGGMAAFFGVLLDPSLLNSTFVFWCLVRAVRCFPLPNVPHGPTIIMSLSAAQILSTWICAPQDLATGYRRFLDRHGNTTPSVHKIIQEQNLFCMFVHPNQPCLQYSAGYFVKEFVRAARLYAPLYFVFFLFGRKSLEDLKRMTGSIIRSSVFLATYCLLASVSGCIFHRIFKNNVNRFTLALHLSASGLATLIERPSRRPELAAYCLTFALDTVYHFFRARGFLRPRSWFSGIVIILASAIIMHHHDQQPQFVIRWLLGIV